jgi:NADH-quinone oxidoreductase subunit E
MTHSHDTHSVPSKPVQFDAAQMARVQELLGRYPEGKQKSAMLPILHLAQDTFDGWLSVPVMDYVAELIGIESIEVYEVASFYSMFELRPIGRCLLEVCRTGPCMVNGADELIEHIEARLGIKVGETTPDGTFTLKTVECLAACGYAPMLQMKDHYYEHLTPAKVDALIEQWEGQYGLAAVN